MNETSAEHCWRCHFWEEWTQALSWLIADSSPFPWASPAPCLNRTFGAQNGSLWPSRAVTVLLTLYSWKLSPPDNETRINQLSNDCAAKWPGDSTGSKMSGSSQHLGTDWQWERIPYIPDNKNNSWWQNGCHMLAGEMRSGFKPIVFIVSWFPLNLWRSKAQRA
jgi:hypothetical protein